MIVTFINSQDEAENMRTFRFLPERKVDYTAGQFIELTIPHRGDERGDKRWFTLSSSPSEDYLAITTRLTSDTGSSFKQSLLSLKPGSEAMMSDPIGDFVLPKDIHIPITFVVAGIGVTPVRSIIKWLLDTQEHRTLQLIYAARNIEEVAFRELFRSYGIPTTIVLSNPPNKWDGLQGRLTAEQIMKLAPDADNKYYYLSGPEVMVEQLVADLAELGVAKSRLATDYFLNYPAI
jgi:glycine betaine catabolism B